MTKSGKYNSIESHPLPEEIQRAVSKRMREFEASARRENVWRLVDSIFIVVVIVLVVLFN